MYCYKQPILFTGDNMKQKHITLFIAIFLFIILNTIVAFNIYKTEYISKDIFRLHIIANSNSIEDQIIKFKIDSKIQKYIKTLNCKNKKELKENIEKNKNTILQIANNTILENNKKYYSTIKLGKISYKKKDNMQIQMYGGTYDSASIILGDGNGKNIWSIIFPNDKTLNKIKELDTIIPGLSNIYAENPKKEKQVQSIIINLIKNN